MLAPLHRHWPSPASRMAGHLSRHHVKLFLGPRVRVLLDLFALLPLFDVMGMQRLLEERFGMTPRCHVFLGAIPTPHEVVVNVVEPLVDDLSLGCVNRDQLFAEPAPEIVHAVTTPSIVLKLLINLLRIRDAMMRTQVSVEPFFLIREVGAAGEVTGPDFGLAVLPSLVSFPVVLAAKLLCAARDCTPIRPVVPFHVLSEIK